MVDAFVRTSEKTRLVVAMRMPEDYNFIPSLLRNNPKGKRTTTGDGRTDLASYSKQLCSLTIRNR